MAMGRGFRAFHTNEKNPSSNPGGYSVVLEQRGKNDVVLFENYAVATMSKFQCIVVSLQNFCDTYALSFYRSQNVLCRSKFLEPAQKFDCI